MVSPFEKGALNIALGSLSHAALWNMRDWLHAHNKGSESVVKPCPVVRGQQKGLCLDSNLLWYYPLAWQGSGQELPLRKEC